MQLFAETYGGLIPRQPKAVIAVDAARPAGLVRDYGLHALAAEKRQILAIWRKLGYSMTANTAANGPLAWVVRLMQNGKQISTLLSDLQRREKAFDKKQKAEGTGDE